MLIQILFHTPLYVWAILALLVWRGIVEMRDREVAIGKLYIMPAVMLALSLQDIVAKFGAGLLPLSAWLAAAAVVSLLVWKFSRAGIGAGAAPGSVRVYGSWMPLAMMLAIFFIKYLAAVTLVVQPNVFNNPLLPAVVCALFGASSGYFLGRLVRNLTSLRPAPCARMHLAAAES